MATWAGLVAFIRGEYEIVGDDPDEITLLFRYPVDEEDDNTRSSRSQMVTVVREIFDQREEWVQIASPFARVGQVNLQTVLQEVGNTMVVGGVAIVGDYLILRHSLPLINLDPNEFIHPLGLLTRSADLMERRFVGRDEH